MDALAELTALEAADSFVSRHIGPSETDIAAMLHAVGAATLNDLAAKTVPPAIRTNQALDLPPPIDEAAVIAELRGLAAKNVLKKSLIGMGYHGTHTPPVIQRNVLESPGWYTAYTPYQAEIAQGRLEALLNFQTMICELTAMEIANASLLDEGDRGGRSDGDGARRQQDEVRRARGGDRPASADPSGARDARAADRDQADGCRAG